MQELIQDELFPRRLIQMCEYAGEPATAGQKMRFGRPQTLFLSLTSEYSVSDSETSVAHGVRVAGWAF